MVDDTPQPQHRRGRPRSERAHQAILDATADLLAESGFGGLRLEHVAARAGVGKATIYRRWASREELALELLTTLAWPHLPVADVGDTRAELLACVLNPIHALTQSAFGPVLRALLSEIASDQTLGERFRASVVAERRAEVRAVIARGIDRGDLRPDVDPGLATALLVGPVYFRLVFGGDLDRRLAEEVVAAYLAGAAPSVANEDWF
ncbi:MAG: TetR/AcrR family transcriptional regulator [Chloroflexota bacterium]